MTLPFIRKVCVVGSQRIGRSDCLSKTQVRIHRLTTSHAPVFLINSRFSLFSATPQRTHPELGERHGVLLIPKLRRNFAEFLNHDSLERLGILYLTT